MHRVFALLMLIAPFGKTAFGQEADFTAPTSVCIDQLLKLPNTSTNATSYFWDFCQGDLALAPTSRSLVNVGGNVIEGIDVVFDGNEWFGFVASRNSNSIIRLDFGSSVLNTPTITDLGNVQGLLKGPTDIRIVHENGNWFGFVYCSTENLITRLSFGTNLKNTAATTEALTAEVVVGGFGSPDSGLDVKKYGSEWVVMFTKNNSVGLVKLATITSIPDNSNVLFHTVNDNVSLADCKLVKSNGSWYGYAVSYAGVKSIQRLRFGTDITSTPVIDDITTNSLGSLTPYGIDVGFDDNTFTLFVASVEGSVVKLNLGNDLNALPSGGVTLGTFGMLSNTLTFKLVKEKSRWFAFTLPWSSGQLFRLDFPGPACAAAPEYSDLQNPYLTFNASGTKSISLLASDGLKSSEKTVSVEVTSSTAPTVSIQTSNVCAESPVNFNVTNAASLASVEWSFGDLTNSTDPSAQHTYQAPGMYTILLSVVGSNGCENFRTTDLKVYEPPSASFILPAGVTCTNNDIEFQNTTAGNYDGLLSYEWKVGGTVASIERNLIYSFAQAGNYLIELKTSIPGCDNSDAQTLQNVLVGPVVDFSFTGYCQDEEIDFQSLITGDVTSLSWDFDGAGNSNESNPSISFSDFGPKEITLSATTAAGCVNHKVRTINISEKPVPDFMIEGPPSSCSGYLSSFLDLSAPLNESVIETWEWTFGDGETSAEQNPKHIFVSAGNFNIQLAVTTDDGCTAYVSKPVSILSSPSVGIENSPACVGKQVTFKSSGSAALAYYWEIGTSYYETKEAVHVFKTPGKYVVQLTAVGENECVTIVQKETDVPKPFIPSFNYSDYCAGLDSRFEVEANADDPISSVAWDFSGEGTSTLNNPIFKFNSTGDKTIKLAVQSLSGCSYASQKIISIVDAPLPEFSIDPDPAVQNNPTHFRNETLNANNFQWAFGDGSTSDESSPAHSFSNVGTYTVTLTASNEAGCSTSIAKDVSTVAALYDVELALLTVNEKQDGSIGLIVTIANKGNTALVDLPIVVNMSGLLQVETIVPTEIPPFSFYNHAIDFSLYRNNKLDYICATALLAQDLSPAGNSTCSQLVEERLTFLAPFPNPASEELSVQWIAHSELTVTIQLVDAAGKIVMAENRLSTPGLNHYSFDLSNVQAGFYIIRLQTTDTSKSFKIQKVAR